MIPSSVVQDLTQSTDFNPAEDTQTGCENVTPGDTTPPVLHLPANIVTQATSAARSCSNIYCYSY